MAKRGHILSARVVVHLLILVELEAVGAGTVCQHGWMLEAWELEETAIFPTEEMEAC